MKERKTFRLDVPKRNKTHKTIRERGNDFIYYVFLNMFTILG